MAKMRFLAIVNEPGEFNELLQLARLLKTSRSAEFLFCFIRPDYVPVERHTEICRKEKFAYVLADSRFSIEAVPFFIKSTSIDDYIPNSSRKTSLVYDTNLWKKEFRKAELSSAQQHRKNRSLELLVMDFLSSSVGVRAINYFTRAKYTGTLVELGHFRTARNRINRAGKYIRAVASYFKPDHVVLAQDFAASENTVAVIEAERLNIPCTILPFAMGTTKEINESLYGSTVHNFKRGILANYFALRFPHWLNVYRGKVLVRAPVGEAMAYILSGYDTNVPWTPQSGRATLLAPSRQSSDYYISAGIMESQIKITGSLNDRYWASDHKKRPKAPEAISWFSQKQVLNLDQMEKVERMRYAVRQALVEEAKGPDSIRNLERMKFFFGETFDSEKFDRRVISLVRKLQAPNLENLIGSEKSKLIIVSWVTDQFGRKGPSLEAKSYLELCNMWAKTLNSIARDYGYTVAVSLHPTLEPSEFSFLEDEYGFFIWGGSLIEVLNQADIFVASVSSTLLWANNFNIPAINYDCYKYGYREFEDAGSILTVMNRTDFEARLRRLIEDKEFYRSLQKRSKERADYWGFFDGESEKRIIEALTASRVVPRGVPRRSG